MIILKFWLMLRISFLSKFKVKYLIACSIAMSSASKTEHKKPILNTLLNTSSLFLNSESWSNVKHHFWNRLRILHNQNFGQHYLFNIRIEVNFDGCGNDWYLTFFSIESLFPSTVSWVVCLIAFNLFISRIFRSISNIPTIVVTASYK